MRHSCVRHGLQISALVLFALPPAFGQTGSGQQGDQLQRAPRLPRTPGTRPPPPRIYVQGEVTLADGSPAPPNVLIERLCGAGNGIPQTYTDAKGRFSFEIGQNTGFTPDATQGFATSTPGQAGEELTSLSGMMNQDFPGLISENSLTGCSLRAVLPGFLSTTLNLDPRGRSDDPDVGPIVLRAIGDVEGHGLSLVSLRAPRPARSSFEEGMKDFQKREWDDARRHFERAVEGFPEHAEAWFALGRVHEEKKNPALARQAFEKAITADSRYVPPRVGLARLDAGEGRWDAVAEATDRVLNMNPNDFPEAYFYNAVAHFNRGRHKAAERSAREALARGAEARFPQVVHLLGVSLGLQSKLEEATVQLKRYLEIAPDADAAPLARRQLAGIEKFLAQQPASAREAPAKP
jgi:tetratricopeptide (TPR) repeat protein